jgi:BMFP domain-containing protein YqiC
MELLSQEFDLQGEQLALCQQENAALAARVKALEATKR